MSDKPYYYNYEHTYQSLLKSSDCFVPSFSLIDFYQKEVRGKVRDVFPNELSVLELGCGQGSLFEGIDEEEIQVTAIDISPTAIGEARKNQFASESKKISYLCADVCDLKLSQKFNLIFDAHTLHCLCGDVEREKFLKVAFEHTDEGGFFALESMVAHKRMDFVGGYYFHEQEQTLFKEMEDPQYQGLRTFYGQRYMPVRAIKRSHEIEEEIFKAGFKIVYFQILSGYKVIYDEKRLQPEIGDPDLLRVICRKL